MEVGSMLEQLKKEVYDANMELQEKGMVIYTWGNVSGIDREKELVVIKPSGVDYDKMKPEDMVVVDLKGNVVEGNYKPSSDTATHLILYRAYPAIGGVVHTHSTWAVTFAQAGMDIPALGTTHADYFYGDIPCTRELSKEEISGDYEVNTGKVIVETIGDKDPMAVPGILVKNHGPFAWGKTPAGSVYNAVVMDKVAEMAYKTMTLNPRVNRVSQYLLDKHYFRKHGANAYYGQGSEDH
jgi:L-ribulose-5-phosphate 4-epimerase